jgi:ubiquinone/menaquinone biosynthesis C-methylase UbiE
MDFDTVWPLAIAIFISVCCVFYLWELTKSYRVSIDLEGIEPFAQGIEPFASGNGEIVQHIDDTCYDAFYAKVYDYLVQPLARAPMETKVALEFAEKTKPRSELRIADIGSGTGIHVELFAREGVLSVVGFDKSEHMVAEAKRRFPTREFVVGDASVATMATADQFDMVTMFYFTVYMVPERTQMLRNIYLWLAPGGVFVCHIVNKVKFDPVLEAASPFVGFSVQKYADNRVTKSAVTFEEFDYVGDFQLNGSRAVYEEVFKFKDGRVRRHEQRVWMPNIDLLVGEVTAAGFKYAHHTDLTAIGYEYNYLFFFQK